MHGKLKITQELAKKAKTGLYETSGDVWRKGEGKWHKEGDLVKEFALLTTKFKALQHDIPVAQFLQTYLSEPGEVETAASLKSYTEGYNAADTVTASTFAMRKGLE